MQSIVLSLLLHDLHFELFLSCCCTVILIESHLGGFKLLTRFWNVREDFKANICNHMSDLQNPLCTVCVRGMCFLKSCNFFNFRSILWDEVGSSMISVERMLFTFECDSCLERVKVSMNNSVDLNIVILMLILRWFGFIVPAF